MAEIAEEQAEQSFDLQKYLNIARRRQMQFLIPAFLGWLLVWGGSWFLPVRYKSVTTILVEQPTMPKDYVIPNVNDDIQDRLQSIKQQVESRTRLLSIIGKFHLYDGGRIPLSADDKVARMIKDIDLDLVEDPRTSQITAFSISYSARTPRLAQEVASELTGLFINENLKVRQQESESTTDFIKNQLQLAAQRLADQEAKVRTFESLHEGELPAQQQSNLQILSGAQSQLQSANAALATATQQREYLQTEISEYKSMHPSGRSADGKATGLAAIDQQLDELHAKLLDLTSRYTDQYPDVIAVKDQIAKTEKIRVAMVADQAKKAASKVDDSASITDPVVSATLLQLQGQLRANQLEISNREHEVAGLRAKIADYEGKVNAEPGVEQQLADLTRGYEQSKRDYDELQKKETDSEQATNLEKVQQGERFTVLDPASLPLKPDFPNRLKFCGIAIGAGVGFGLAFVVLLEFLDDRMHSENEIKALLGVPILSEIPEILTPKDEQVNKRKLLIAWVSTGFVAVIILAGSAFSYLHN
jgi:polysaccharide biosynthesis transport protein